MGTSEFAVPILEALVRAGYQVVAVFTQPDRPAGRGLKPQPPPVKQRALALGLPVYQPETLRDEKVLAQIAALAPDIIVVAAYGEILPRRLLTLPRLGCLNVHPSLLPKLRGAAPVQAAIRQGLTETGVTIALMTPKLDAGPILAQRTVPIHPEDTARTLGERLARIGAELLLETLPRWAAGVITPQPQDESQATYAPPVRKEDGLIDWQQSAEEIWRQCRAYDPWPGCFTFWKGQLLKLGRVWPNPSWHGPEPPGTVLLLPGPDGRPRLAVATGHGALIVESLQLAGRRLLSAEEFLRGQRDFVGSRLGQAAA